MKELSIEQKAKRYDEAIEIINDYYQKTRYSSLSCASNDIEVLEKAFPELKESEDEQHCKWILEYLYDGLRKSDEQFKDHFKAAIAWLEKQGEQKPVISDEAIREGVAHFGITQYQIDNWLKKYIDVEKQCEQKPTNEPKYKVGDIIRLKDGDGLEWTVEEVFNNGYYTIVCADRDDFILLDDNWELVEQKSTEWSEEDETRLTNIIIMLKEGASHHFIKDDIKKSVDWLKSLKDRVQRKQEWSEDVEDAITLLKDIAEEQEKDYCPYNANDLRKAAQYLETCRPQNTWKPSEEQIKAVKEAACYSSVFSEKTIDNLIALSKQLKKLREE